MCKKIGIYQHVLLIVGNYLRFLNTLFYRYSHYSALASFFNLWKDTGTGS